MFNCPVWLLEGNWVYHEGIYNQYSIVVGGTIDQLVAGCSWGGLPTTKHVWGWNQQPMRIINQWKFCQQEDVLLRRWLVFQIQGFLPSTRSSNRWAHLAGARRSKKLSGLGTCSDGWMRVLKRQSELVRSDKSGPQFMNWSSMKYQGFVSGGLILDMGQVFKLSKPERRVICSMLVLTLLFL